jgi:hypothetical protein
LLPAGRGGRKARRKIWASLYRRGPADTWIDMTYTSLDNSLDLRSLALQISLGQLPWDRFCKDAKEDSVSRARRNAAGNVEEFFAS